MKFITYLIFLFFTVNLFSQSDTSLTFNEVMFKTSSGSNSEFIELYNTSSTDTIDLNNFKIKYYTSGADVIVSAGFGTLLPSKSYAVIFEGDYDLSTGIYNGLVPASALILKLNNNAFGSSGMSNSSSRRLILMNSAGDTLDTYTYSANNSTNISDEKIETNKNNSSANWTNSTQVNGTPGFRNSVTPLSFDLVLSSILISPPIILEDNNINITATVKNTGSQIASSYSIEIFNDTNFDSVGTASEKIFAQSFSNLAANDSVSVSTTIANSSAGKINIIAKVIFAIDEDTANNTKFTSVNVFPILHQFNDIVVNEIMYAPLAGRTEWVEIYNRTDSSVNLNGWRFGDNSTTVIVSNTDINIPKSSFVILSKDSSILNNYNIPVQLIVLDNMPSLNNGGDAVVIKDSLGLLIDSLSYLSSWGGENGKSLERIEPNVGSALQSNWGTSVNPMGATPGEINSLTQKDFNIGVTDIIFNPDKPFKGDNVKISAVVNNSGKNAIQYSLQLYEMTNADIFPGILVETKANLSILPGEDKTESFNFQITNLQNVRAFVVKAVLASDQDTTDNLKQKIIAPGYRQSTIVINEIMYTPVGGEPEWIELYNTSADPINLVGWSLTDRFATPVSVFVNSYVFIPPKSYLVIARDSSIFNFHKAIPSKLVILNLPGLNNDADGVVLRDDRNLMIDSVLYNNNWGGMNGFSLERKDISVESNLAGNWASSTDNEMSTPGRINSISDRKFDLRAVKIFFSPQFPVAGDNITPSLKIVNKGQSNAYNFSVQFFIDGNSDNIPDQLLSTETELNLAGFDSVYINSSSDIENLREKVLVGANIVFPQDEDTLNNYAEAFIQPGFARNSLVINEVMFAPFSGQPEWIELINNSDEQINLKNWAVSDVLPSPTKNFITNSDLIINPDEYIILTKDSSFFSFYPNVTSTVKIVNFGSLGNTSDGIIIYDFRDAIIDSLFYSSKWGGSKGFSLERISSDMPTNDSTNWTTSLSVNYSTPGSVNSIKNIRSGVKGELVINEIMYNPGAGNNEFIEFYNKSSNDVNIGGWKITDENGNSLKLSQTSFLIQPENYFLLAADSSIIKNYGVSGQNISVLNISSLGLSNSGELIHLTDFLGSTIDSVYYSDKWNNENFTDTKNKSLERINPAIDGNDKNNWSTSVNPSGATPGKKNSIFTEKLRTQSNITISPNPFSPDNDGFEDFTIISYNLTQPIAQVKVKIYNSTGRLVRTLENNLASGSSGSIIFNGLDEEKNPLRMGIYIVYLEALNKNSGTVEALKAALVVARKLN